MVKQADPDGLVTYASYPPTEYLDLSFLDFVTFNVYLHDHAAFRDYVFRLQNLVGDRPLVLGELGLDTLRHGEAEQARLLAGHLRETELMGLAGAYVFSWTDDWHTGGHPVEDWAFGITDADRAPKVSYHAVQQVFKAPLPLLLEETPRVSVVVCSHNGGATLDECLRSLCTLDYPDYEVIVVDDGSTDDTREILARFPEVRGHPPGSSRPECRAKRRAPARHGRRDRLHRFRLRGRPELADPPGPSTAAERGGGGGGAEPDARGWLAGRVRGGRAGAADARPGKRPGRRAHPRLQHGLPPRGPRGDQRVRSPVSQGRRRCGYLLAAPARGSLDHLRAGGVRLAPSPPEPAFVPQATGRLWRGRGAAPLQAPGQVQRPRRRQVGRGDVRRLAPGPSARRADHLSRHVRDRDVPVPLSAGRRPLGDVAQHTRMAGGRPAARPGGGARPSLGVGPRGGYAGPVAAGRRLAGGPGPPRPDPPTQVCPTPHRRALLCPAARPVLDAVPDPAVIATCPRVSIRRRRMALGSGCR